MNERMQNQSRKSSARKREGMRRGIAILPNLLTTANLFCGFLSITKTLAGDFVAASWIVVIAGFFDFADGRVARMTKTQSDFGVEYDSLSDLTTFCMAPAILAYQWSLHSYNRLGLAVSFLFFVCGALRLARFNVQSSSVEKEGFQGLPTPAGAGMIVSFVIFSTRVWGEAVRPAFFIGLMVFLAILMVSNVKYRSFKKLDRRHSFVLLLGVVVTIAVILAEPEINLFLFGCVFVSVGLVEWLWKSPQRIKNFGELVHSFFEDRRAMQEYQARPENGKVVNLNSKADKE